MCFCITVIFTGGGVFRGFEEDGRHHCVREISIGGVLRRSRGEIPWGGRGEVIMIYIVCTHGLVSLFSLGFFLLLFLFF